MRRFALTAIVCLLAAVIAPADIQSDARKIQERHQDAVVYLKAVIEFDRGGRKREATLETLGTLISEGGLIVTSNSNLGQSADRDGNTPDLRDLKVLMPDGPELSAKLVIQDSDLDLAFVQIEKGGEEDVYKPVALLDEGSKFELFDHFVTLGRQEEDLERRSSLSVGRVMAVVKRPRLVYGATAGAYGAPAFNAAGDLVGVLVRKVYQGKLGSMIILPSKAIHKVAQQIAAEPEGEADDDEPQEEAAEIEPEAPEV